MNENPHSRPSALRPASILLLAAALAAVLAGGPGPARAGSTGPTALFMPQGGAAGTGNGDYVSSGLDTFYRYFVEVPPSLARLRIQLFDADVGAGGANEENAGRDRDRNGYGTTFTYSLIDPTGVARSVRFTTGNTAGPAGADNAWLSLYDGTGREVRDNFGTAAYTNDDGTDNWTGAWIEADGGGGGATGGAVRITGGELRLQDGVSGTPSIQREADLLGSPGLGLAVAYLSFDYRTSGNLEDGDEIAVQVSANGGGSWTTLETFSNDSSGSRTYDVTASIANNTRVRFLLVDDYTGTEFFFVDNLRIHDGGPLTAGHWELRADGSAGGDDINALGIRADDGDATSGGTEINVYYDSHAQYGVNPPASGTQSRSYDEYPYVTSGCTYAKNDFDYDTNSGDIGSITVTSRTGAFNQTFGEATLSENNEWDRDFVTGWTSDALSTDYGIWSMDLTINSYLAPGVNGNYTNVYFGDFQAAAPPPAANPTANAFRVYLPTDAGAAPVKPYLEQLLTHAAGVNPPLVGVASRFEVTVRLVNPTTRAITFSASNLVTSNVPGGGAVYAGSAQVSQGSIVSQPAVGGTGIVTWNPGTVAAGATALLAYRVDFIAAAAGQRIALTATPASGNGTRAQYVDETGNTTQARATHLLGPVCELAATQGLLTQAVVSSFDVYEQDGAVIAEWQTASEAGTAGFQLLRRDGGRWLDVGGLVPALLGSPQGGTYRVRDEAASPRERQRYLLVEAEAAGGRRTHGPFEREVDWQRARAEGFRPLAGGYERTAHAPAARAPAAGDTGAGLIAAWAEAGPAAAWDDAFLPAGERAVHISVRETGLHFVRASEIAPFLGLPERSVGALLAFGKLELTRGGRRVAWRPVLEGLRAVGLLFYGQAIDSLYTRDNVYRLGRGQGLLMSTRQVTPAGGTPAGSFLDSRHFETDALPATSLALAPASDYWFWEFLLAGDPTFGTRRFALDAPGLATAGTGSLRVRLHGGTATGVAGEHRAVVSLNGAPLGELRWTGIAAREAAFPVDAALLRETGNEVAVAGLLEPGVPFSVFYVDSFDLTYPRRFLAAGEALAFRGDGALAVSGFTAPPVALLDLADPFQPQWLTRAAVAPDGAGGFSVSFLAPARGGTYLATGPAALRAPQALRAWSPPDLASDANRADYLVIAPPELAGPARRLADLRAAQGLLARVVDLRQVADEFGDGVPTPLALRDFLQLAQRIWRTRPRYVVLAGAGSVDYRDLLGAGGNLLPPMMVPSAGGLFPADNRLATSVLRGGNGLPGMAIGRIPARTAAELDAYVDKLAAYEAALAGSWAGEALFFADAPDQGANFAAAAGRSAGLLPPGYRPEIIDLGTTPLAAARARLLQGFADGASLVAYLGHGGLDRLAGAGLLTSGDVAALPAGTRLPVLTAMTCTANRFAVPGVPALGELLTTRAGGGAVAVWAPSGLSVHAEAGLLAERFYRRVAAASASGAAGEARLGDLILGALGELRALGGSQAMIDIYNLLGDPALRLKRPAPAPTVGSGPGGE